jgi:hypothetical protein
MFSLASFLVLAVTVVQGFTPLPLKTQLTTSSTSTSLHKTLKDLVDDAKNMVDDAVENVENVFIREELKQEILQLGASYDRGFGASPRVRNKVNKVIADLEFLNQEMNASRFISGPEMVMNITQTNTTSGNSTTMAVSKSKKETSPLTGNWRLIWTTASDVLILGANPFVTVGAIYQLFDPPIVTNVIDLLPRIQNLFPPSMVQGSLLRATVQTRASKRSDPMRIGLDFESVKLSPVELLGQDVGSLPPLGFNLPKLMEMPDDVGFFDVTFLDDEMLIIRQNQPGGLFVLAKVEDTDP